MANQTPPICFLDLSHSLRPEVDTYESSCKHIYIYIYIYISSDLSDIVSCWWLCHILKSSMEKLRVHEAHNNRHVDF